MATILAGIVLVILVPPITLYKRYQEQWRHHQVLRPKPVRHTARLDVQQNSTDANPAVRRDEELHVADSSSLEPQVSNRNDPSDESLPITTWNPLDQLSPIIITSPGSDDTPTHISLHSSEYTSSPGDSNLAPLSDNITTPLTSPPVEKDDYFTYQRSDKSPLLYKTNKVANINSRILSSDGSASEEDSQEEPIFEDVRRRILFTKVEPSGIPSSIEDSISTSSPDPSPLPSAIARNGSVNEESPKNPREPSTEAASPHESSRDTGKPTGASTTVSTIRKVSGELILEYIVSSDIRKRLRGNTCTATRVKAGKSLISCSKTRPGNFNNEIAVKLLDDLSICYERKRYAEFATKLKSLVHMGWCSLHKSRSKTHDSCFVTLPDTLYELDRIHTKNGHDATPLLIEPGVMNQWLEMLFKLKDVLEKPRILHTNSLPLGEFQVYVPKSIKSKTTFHAIHDVLWNHFSNHEAKEGYIYVYMYRTHREYVKVGVTKHFDERLRQWNGCCRRTYEYANSEHILVNCAARLEKIIHAELKDWRRQMPCEKSKRFHREWFEVDLEHVNKVIQKWQNWVTKKNPFEIGFNKRWRLRMDMLQSLEEICRPLPIEKIVPKTAGVHAV